MLYEGPDRFARICGDVQNRSGCTILTLRQWDGMRVACLWAPMFLRSTNAEASHDTVSLLTPKAETSCRLAGWAMWEGRGESCSSCHQSAHAALSCRS